MPFPNMQAAIMPLFSNIQITTLSTKLVDGEAVQSETTQTLQGAVVPLKYRDLVLKPEEQRAWKWKALYCNSAVSLDIGEHITYNSMRYKVMSDLDLSEFGINGFHLVEDFQ